MQNGFDLEKLQGETGLSTEYNTLGDVVSGLLPYIFVFGGILMLLYLIYGGLHLMISRGDPKAVQEAKGKITNAIVGFLIIFASFWIVQIIGRVFGIEVFISIFG